MKCLIYELLPNGTLEDALEIGVSPFNYAIPKIYYVHTHNPLSILPLRTVHLTFLFSFTLPHLSLSLSLSVCLSLSLSQLENTTQNSSSHRSDGIRLPWMCRLSIATDTARGLAYLHTADKQNPLVHRDVKRYCVFHVNFLRITILVVVIGKCLLFMLYVYMYIVDKGLS